MKMIFVIIGFACNSLGCYWAKDSRFHETFNTQEECDAVRSSAGQSITFFQSACLLEKRE